MKRPERALVMLKPKYLGDAVMAVPLLDALAEAYSRPVVVCGPVAYELFSDGTDRLELERGSRAKGLRGVFEAARRLRSYRAQHAFVVNRSFRSALSVRLAGIPVRIGHDTEGRGFLLTHRVTYDPKKFEAECYLDLAEKAEIAVKERRPRLRLSPEESARGQELLQGAEIGLQPGATYAAKQIPPETLVGAAKRLMERGFRLALVGGKDEAAKAVPVLRALGNEAVDLVGKLTIRESMGALAGLKAVVGSDTGLMHVAAAVGCPSVVVFGPTPSQKWGHRFGANQILEAPGGVMADVQPGLIEAAVMAGINGRAR